MTFKKLVFAFYLLVALFHLFKALDEIVDGKLFQIALF
jgi:hypothetical protein